MSRKSVIGVFFTGSGVLALVGMFVLVAHQRHLLAALRAENQTLQASAHEMDRLRSEVQDAQRLRHQETEIQQLRDNNKELLRLRNEVHQLREQAQELETLRAANAQLLQAVQSSGGSPPNRQALVTSARRKGSILGVNVLSANDPRSGVATAGRAGVVVTGLMPDSPTAESGLKPGDLIVALDGRAIDSVGQLQTELLTRKPGETVLVDVLRGNAPLRLQVITRAWPESP